MNDLLPRTKPHQQTAFALQRPLGCNNSRARRNAVIAHDLFVCWWIYLSKCCSNLQPKFLSAELEFEPKAHIGWSKTLFGPVLGLMSTTVWLFPSPKQPRQNPCKCQKHKTQWFTDTKHYGLTFVLPSNPRLCVQMSASPRKRGRGK